MKAIQEKIMIRLAIAALLPVAQGCAALAAPPVMMISMASTVVGSLANGSVMGGSTVGVIRNAAFSDSIAGGEELWTAQSKPVATVAAAKDTATPRLANAATPQFANAATPQFASGLERACYFPNASGRGLPCT